MMIPLRKEHAGSCSFGYTWPEDGSVVEVTPEHAVALLAIPDGDYTAVDAEPDSAKGSESPEEPEQAETAIEEPAPAAELSEAPPARKTTAKKTAAKKEASPAPDAPAPVEE